MSGIGYAPISVLHLMQVTSYCHAVASRPTEIRAAVPHARKGSETTSQGERVQDLRASIQFTIRFVPESGPRTGLVAGSFVSAGLRVTRQRSGRRLAVVPVRQVTVSERASPHRMSVTEVAATRPGRRASVGIRPVATTDDQNASRERLDPG
ncbi:hypothetical protein Ate01nite_67000 [Actinoplanes teichomyceticus]|nr:hypothetical protein Ate01nite_67000 [Actinoplanes teichomyceticus]